MPPLPPLLLASASPRRRELLQRLVPTFEVVPSAAGEIHDPTLPPDALCTLNARIKATDIAGRHPGNRVLGADTLVFLDRTPLGKPRDLDDARRMLGELSGRTHTVVTGVCLIDPHGPGPSLFAVSTNVRFRSLAPADIEEYLAHVPVLDKAGAYAVQQLPHRIIASVEGSLSNVIGLPLEALSLHLSQPRPA